MSVDVPGLCFGVKKGNKHETQRRCLTTIHWRRCSTMKNLWLGRQKHRADIWASKFVLVHHACWSKFSSSPINSPISNNEPQWDVLVRRKKVEVENLDLILLTKHRASTARISSYVSLLFTFIFFTPMRCMLAIKLIESFAGIHTTLQDFLLTKLFAAFSHYHLYWYMQPINVDTAV